MTPEFNKAKRESLIKWNEILEDAENLHDAICGSCGFCTTYKKGNYVCPAVHICGSCRGYENTAFSIIHNGSYELNRNIMKIISDIKALEDPGNAA